MAVNFFNGDPTDNMDAALSDELTYPKWIVSYNDGAEVWVYNEDDQPPSAEQVAERNGVMQYHEFNTQE